MRNFLLLALLSLCALSLSAQTSGKQTTHKVEKGETLYAISKKYHVSIDAIEKANKAITGDMKIKPGQSINIPATTTQAETKPATAAKPEAAKSEKSKPATSEKKATTATTPAKSATITAKPTVGDNPSTHTIAKGESLYSLAKVYSVTVRQLKEANNMGDDAKLKVGLKLNIPSKNPEAMYESGPKEAKPELKAEETTIIKPYTESKSVRAGIEEMPNDNAPVEKKETVKPVLIPVKVSEEKPTTPIVNDKPKEIVREEKAPEPKEPKSPAPPSNVAPSDYVNIFSEYGGSGKKKVVYRGIGSFLKSENPGNQFLALYNYADMGAILKVTNLMSKQAIYVKVIGKVPAADAQNEIILKVSSEAATQLKVAEDKFLVEVTGYNPQ